MREGVAAVLDAVGEPLRVADVQVHAPGAGHVLVRMVAARVGEADRATFAGAFSGRLPLVMGAEGAGVVEAVGPGIARVSPGDHVLVTDARAFLPARAGVSASFRPVGTFATYAVVPARRLIRVHPALPLRQVAEAGGATLAGYAAGLRAGAGAAGGALLIVGLGEVGQGALAAALTGAALRVVAIDRRPSRLAWARALGAETALAGGSDLGRLVRAAVGGHGADAAVLTGDTGGAPIRLGTMIRAGAAVVHAGHPGADEAFEGPEALADRFAHDRLATGALCGLDRELEDLSELLAAGEGAGTVAALLELSFDMP